MIMRRSALLAVLTIAVLTIAGQTVAPSRADAADSRNWSPPARRIYAQTLSDQTMRARPDLLSVTFHGVPPGSSDLYTMFAGSYPDRIGNADDPDDIDVSKKGITIIDPRWHRTKDTTPKFVILMPLRDVHVQNVGLIVYAFRTAAHPGWGERQYFAAAEKLRDALEPKILSYSALFMTSH